MLGKIVLSLIFFLLLLISYSLFFGFIDLRSHFFLQSDQRNSHLCNSSQSPLRVFMYDLPPRFNIAMINHRSSNETPVTAQNLPPWPSNSGLRKQHSVEYWMMASLLYEGDANANADAENTREAIRVSDPEMAEVFFVPFFSSMSFNTHGHNMTDPDTEIDRQLQIDLLEFLRKSKYWQRSEGRDHVIPMHHPNAFRFLRDQVNASILVVSDFGRYPKNMSYLSKDVVAPYVHVVDSFINDDPPDPFEIRTTLLFFRGRTVRKDEGVVRAKLEKILAGYDDVHYEKLCNRRQHKSSKWRGYGNVLFSNVVGVFCEFEEERLTREKGCILAGDTPSSCRLFDAIVSHCVPIIVSDRIELPYEEELDYNQFSIFFSDQEAVKPGYMVEQLRKISKERWIEMWKRLKNISHHYEFQYPPKREDAVNMVWRQVRHKLPVAKLAEHRSRRLKIPDWWDRQKRR